jgi:hypothetical protein
MTGTRPGRADARSPNPVGRTMAGVRRRLPDPDRLSTGAGLLAAAALLAAPIVVGAPVFARDVEVVGIPLAAVLALGGLLVAVAGGADLLGRTELRQGVAVLGLAGLLGAGTLLVVALGEVLDPSGSSDLDWAVPYAVVAVWASALVVGTVAWGPTRSAVLIGLVTIAVALLIPVGPDSEPFLAVALDSIWSYVLVPAGAAVLVGIWRLLDLPQVGGVLLGGGLVIFATVWLQGAPAVAELCPAGVSTCLQPGDIQRVIWVGCLFVAFGSLFGVPARDPEMSTAAPSR